MGIEIKERLNEIISEWLVSFIPNSESISEETAMELYYSGICFMDSYGRFRDHILPLMVGKTPEEFITIVKRLEVKRQYGGLCYVYLKETSSDYIM